MKTKNEILDYHTSRIGEAAKKQATLNAMEEYANQKAKQAILYALEHGDKPHTGSINDFVNKALNSINN